MNEDTVSVLKFGGSSFASPDAYHVAARHLAERVERGERLCVVVSAMSGTTGRLSELLHSIVPSPEPQDMDAVLATGEILASTLMRAVLGMHRIDAISLNAFQLAWRASADFTAGNLTDYPGTAIADALRRAPVVVISGGQAVTDDNRLVMLGRNSSDLTAIAVAVAMQCSDVTIYSDAEGVFTADPYRLANTSLIPQLCYRHAKAYSQWGAKVLHSGCVEFAKRHRVRIRCASLTYEGNTCIGTEISESGQGVQVCLPDDVVICQVPTYPSNRLVSPEFEAEQTPVVNKPGHFAVRLNDRYRELASTGALTTVDELAPVAAFSLDGELHVYAVPRAEREAYAQGIHDRLVKGTSFPKVHRTLMKRRGSHSDVYGSVSQKESI